MSAPPGPPPSGGPPPTWYPPPYPMWPYPPPPKADHTALIVVIVVVAVVALIIVPAVLYVLVSGLLAGPTSPPRLLIMTISRSPDETNWTVLFTSVPSALRAADTRLAVRQPGGGTALQATAFPELRYTDHGALYVADGDAFVEAGESLLLSIARYGIGHRIEISDGSGLLAFATLS